MDTEIARDRRSCRYAATAAAAATEGVEPCDAIAASYGILRVGRRLTHDVQ